MTLDEEHQALHDGVVRLGEVTQDTPGRVFETLHALVGSEHGESGLLGILARHKPEQAQGAAPEGRCSHGGCWCEYDEDPRPMWQDCPEVKVVRLALVVTGVMG